MGNEHGKPAVLNVEVSLKAAPPFPGYFLYHSSHRHVPAKLWALMDFLKV